MRSFECITARDAEHARKIPYVAVVVAEPAGALFDDALQVPRQSLGAFGCLDHCAMIDAREVFRREFAWLAEQPPGV